MTRPGKMNIFDHHPASLTAEAIDLLLERPGIRIERIVSLGQATPAGEWYDQPDDEWVLLLSGSAGLLVEGDAAPVILQRGDFLLLPARCRHRVEWTDKEETTVWLACHIKTQVDRLKAEDC